MYYPDGGKEKQKMVRSKALVLGGAASPRRPNGGAFGKSALPD